MWSSLAISAIACGPPEPLPLPEPSWRGENVEVGASVDLDATCRGSLEYVDAYVGALTDLLGTTRDGPVEVYWLADGADAYGCDAERGTGCSFGHRALSQIFPMEHELVHAVAEDLGARPSSHPLLEEGLAMHVGDDFPLDWGRSGSIREVLDDIDALGYVPPDGYATAASFVAYLVRDFGWEPVLELVRVSAYGDSRGELNDAVERNLGRTLAQVADAFDAAGYACDPFRARDATISCDLSLPTSVPCGDDLLLRTGIAAAAGLECGDEGVIGPKLGQLWQSFVFEVPVAGEYVAFAASLDPEDETADVARHAWIVIESCAAGCERLMAEVPVTTWRLGAWAPDEAGVALMLDPGRYRVRLAWDVDAEADVSGLGFEVRPTSLDAFDAFCGANPGWTTAPSD